MTHGVVSAASARSLQIHRRRDYYLAEAQRLRAEFETKTDLAKKLGLGRAIEAFLDRAAEYDRRMAER